MVLCVMVSSKLQYKTTLRIVAEGRAFGPGVAMVLQGVRTHGSLAGAAKQMHMSYSKAWTIIKGAEQIWGFPLTRRHAGGKMGGSSTLTPQAECILSRYEAMQQAIDKAAKETFDAFFNEEELEKMRNMPADGKTDKGDAQE